jgi:hypothetical protein
VSTVEVEGAVLVEFIRIDASACRLVRSLMSCMSNQRRYWSAGKLLNFSRTRSFGCLWPAFHACQVRLTMAAGLCFSAHGNQATAAAAFFARTARFGGRFPERLCSIAGLTITSISAR